MTDSQSRRLIFRADGNATIGLGHLMRLLALADMLRGLAPGIFMLREPTSAVTQLITQAGWDIHALPASPLAVEAEWLASSFLGPSDVLVLDGYDFTQAYQLRVRQSGCSLVYIDDLRAWPVVADVLINHSPGVSAADYQAPASARLLLGAGFSLLRRPFLEAAQPPQRSTDVTSALICFGGADPLGLTARTLGALQNLPQLQRIGLLVGAAFKDEKALQQADLKLSTTTVAIYRNLNATELAALLQAHDVAIVPASTVLIEALVVGRPAITGYYADNQQALAEYVHMHQQAFSVGNFADLAPAQLTELLRQGLAWLETQPRRPYAPQLQPDQLRGAIQHLLDR